MHDGQGTDLPEAEGDKLSASPWERMSNKWRLNKLIKGNFEATKGSTSTKKTVQT